MLRQEPEIDRARQTKSDHDDGHGLKTGLVQRKEVRQDGGERMDGVVIYLKDPPWEVEAFKLPLVRALANFRRVVSSEGV